MWGHGVMNWRAAYKRLLLLLLLAAISSWMTPARAKVSQALLNVDLKNPGSVVSGMTFYVFSPGIGNKVAGGKNPVSVVSPPGTSKRFTDSNDQQAGLTVTFIGADLVRVTLTPLKTWAMTDNIQFIMTVANTNSIRIAGTAGFGAQPPVWLNNNNPATAISPRPRLPGFQVVTKDADLTLYNDLTDSFGVQDLGFLPNITESAFDNLDLDLLLARSFDSSEPAFTLPPANLQDFPDLPDPDPGNVFAADEQLLDPSSGEVIGAFAEGVEAVPEPSTLALLGAVLVFAPLGRRLARIGSRRR